MTRFLAIRLVAVLWGLLLARPVLAQESSGWTLARYLQKVAASNLELLAQKLSVPIAEAQISIARMFPDPQLSAGVAQVDVSGQGAPLISTLGVTLPLEIGGKRGGRIAVAASEAAVAQANFQDFLRVLRADAAGAYIDALYNRLIQTRKQRTLESLEKLVSINQQRLKVGDIGEVPLMQSRVEAERFRGEVLAAQAEVRAAELKMTQFLGQAQPVELGPVAVFGDLRISERLFDENKLVEQARTQRPDVYAQQLGQQTARARTALARANRYPDTSLTLSWQRSLNSDIFQSPQYDGLTATASLALPFSRVYHGELDAARHGQARAAHQLGSVALRAEIEVRTALVRYRAAAAQVKLYTQDVLADADRVHAAMLYTYQHGSATLLEVLTAQRTVDEIYLAYYNALAEHAHQLVLVEQAAGIWDLDF